MPEAVELYVVMHCEACAASVKRAVKKIPGVESYKIDYYGQKVTVVGNVDREDVWRRIHKTGKRVTLIPKPAPPKEEPTAEKKEETKEETQAETKRETEKEKKEEDTVTDKGKKKETKVEEKTTEVKVEETKQDNNTEETTKVVDAKEEVKVHETKEEVATVVETTEEMKEGTPQGTKEDDAKANKEPEKSLREPEWAPMFVSAPYYTLSSRFY